MNLYALSNLLVSITSFSMAIFIFSQGYRHRFTRLWSLFAFSVALYGFGAYMATTALQQSRGFFWWQVSYVGVILIPYLFVSFVLEFLNIKQRAFQWFIGICTLIFLIADIFSKNLFIGNVNLLFTGSQWVRPAYWVYPPGPMHIFFTFFAFGGWVMYAHYKLIKDFIRSSGVRRNQIKYFFLATALGFAGGATSFLPCFGIHIYPIFNFTVVLYPVIMTYAIFRYNLMDITIVITRTGIFIAVYTIVLGFPFAWAAYFKHWLITHIGPHWWALPLGLMAALATVGPFIYIFLERRAEERLLREQRRYQDTLKHAAVGMTRIRNLRKLLSLIAHIVTKAVKISFTGIYLLDKQTNEYVLQVFRGSNKVPVNKISGDSTLIKRLLAEQLPLVYEEIKRKMQESTVPTDKALEANMRLLTASVVIPSFLDQRLSGFIVLGEKLSKQIYTTDDLNVFQVLASQAALAIENAQFYEEAKEMQAQIAQAEKMATVGTMADGLSHQINNRFYALSLIAGDSIDTIKLTDTSACSPEIKAMVSQINAALERIQVNVMQGGEVVKGILKYTRKGQEGFEALSLDQIINGTLEMVQYKVKLQEIDLIRDYPQDLPKLKVNLVQMQEVFFNLIDNGYDAIVERRLTLKEPGYRGSITISAQPKGRSIELKVRDTGMGVKAEDLKKIFTPFFTTKASSRKGTGLGLYVIRTIVTENHAGKIFFASEYKRGTMFTIELPIADESAPADTVDNKPK